jgi:hypothetical protein
MWIAVVFFVLVVLWKVLDWKIEQFKKERTLRRGPKTSQVKRNLALKIGKIVGHAPETKNFLVWPKHANKPGAVIKIRYAEGWTALDRQTAVIHELIEQIAGGKWTTAHDHLHNELIYIRQAPPTTLPASYKYPDTGSIDHIPVAVDANSRDIVADLTSQSPHVLVAGSTGGGKTTTVTVLIAHVAARGGLVSICDPKMVGYQKTFEGLHNVQVSVPNLDDGVEDMIMMVAEFYFEMRTRYAYMREHKLTELTDHAQFPTRVLAIDEMGSFVSMIKEHWQNARRRGDPPKPPTLDTLQKILWQGRMARCHIICAVQQANVDAIGGSGSSDMREMYGLRIFCGSPGAHGGRLLFGTDDIPQVNAVLGEEVKGRGLISREGGDVIAVQLAFLPRADARRIAHRGNAQFSDPEPNVVEESEDPTYARARTRVEAVDIPETTVETVDNPEPRRAGRPPRERRSLVPMTCGACAHSWTTTAANGTAVHCPSCGKAKRVPADARA